MSLPAVQDSLAQSRLFVGHIRQRRGLGKLFPQPSWQLPYSAVRPGQAKRSLSRNVIEDTPSPSSSYDPSGVSLSEYQVLFNNRHASKGGLGTAASIAASAQVLFRTAIKSLDLPRAVDSENAAQDYVDLIETDFHDSSAAFSKPNYEVLKLDNLGKVRRVCVRRRDLLREYRLQPRDLRRIDPSIDHAKPSPSITIKENVLLLNLGGIRAIVAASKALLFDANSSTTRKFLEILVPRIHINTATGSKYSRANDSFEEYMANYYEQSKEHQDRSLPFELEVLEAALTIATGRLEVELLSVTKRVSQLLTKLPQQINPLNLDELRRTKQALVELETKADTLRKMLEELMDDEDELVELNLSSRPQREERRRQRERERLERELERAREMQEEIEERRSLDEDKIGNGSKPLGPYEGGRKPAVNGHEVPSSRVSGYGSPNDIHLPMDQLKQATGYTVTGPAPGLSPLQRPAANLPDNDHTRPEAQEDDGEYKIQDAQDALEEMVEQEEEEREVEEVEDLLEYYLQRATDTQGEAERLLQSARDLEESIGVSLSARRYEVNRLELTLSIGSFAAAIGAMVAGIFGMNMRSMLEMSVWSFWGVTGAIVVGCMYIFFAIMKYTKGKKIL